MNKLIAVLAVGLAASLAHAEDSACMAAAKEKKLAGAAKNSNVKKCGKESGPAPA